MEKPKSELIGADVLRQRAEKLFKEKKSKVSFKSSEDDLRRLLHELQVHQIELEIQNEELLLANEKIEELASEKYKELYDFAPSGYITLSKMGEITELNFSAARLLGKERKLLIKKKFENYISAETRIIYNLFLNKLFASNKKQSCELILASEFKSPKFVNVDGILNQDLNLCLLTMVDNTDKKLAEISLVEAKLKAEESDRLKSAFLANMSHEIRTPMNGILGFAELLEETTLKDENQQKYISIIEKSGARMLNIINEIIDISKIESGQMTLTISDVNINKCLDECYGFFTPEAAKKNIELKLTKTIQNDDVIIKTDQDKLNGVLTNLVKNAIKYTKHGSIEIGYSLNSSKTEIEFYVKDTGIGIPGDRQAAIFERFIQADIEDKMAQQGAGLGLAISNAYIGMLGGKIWVESEVNVGTTFYFTIPYTIGNFSEKDFANSKEWKKVQNLKILIVEDDEISCQLAKIMVNSFANESIIAKTGKEAINACQNNPDIDLILMDIQLPYWNGYEATRQIRKFNKEVIIIAQTAFALSGDREKSIAAGCNDYIAKPLRKAELETLIQKHINKSENIN